MSADMTRPAKLVNVRREVVADHDPDTSYLEQEGFEDRLAAYRRGEFGFVGVVATATLHLPYGEVWNLPDSWIIQEISSPGLWGIEDDSGDDYLDEVYAEELETLRGMLYTLGVSAEKFEEVRSS